MLMRSPGLGKTELGADIQDVKRKGDHLILYMDTLEPVRWRVRATVTLREIKRLILVSLKLSIVVFLLNPVRWFRTPRHPGDY